MIIVGNIYAGLSSSTGGGMVNTLNNGLTLVGTNGQLGGPLVKDTNIDLAGFDLALGVNNNGVEIDDTNNIVAIEAGDGVTTEAIVLATSGMVVTDTANSQGLTNAQDYSGNTNPLRLVQLNELTGPVATNKVAGSSASGTLIDYVVPGSTGLIFRVNSTMIVRTYTSGNISVSVAYTDETGTARTFAFTPLNSTGAAAYPATAIYAQQGTHIIISSVITGVAIADFGTVLELLA